MQTNTLTVRQCAESGELGYCLDDLPRDIEHSVATEGLLIAHDLIEHQNGTKRIGPIADEMQALGAIWFVRGQWGDLRRDNVGSMHSVEQNIASDFARMVQDHQWNGEKLYAGKTEAHGHDNTFCEIVRLAKRDARQEMEDIDAALWKEFWSVCVPFMRIGFDKAEKRFGDGLKANTQFWSIAEALQPYMQRAEYEGQRIELSWGNGEAFCDEILFDDEEDFLE